MQKSFGVHEEHRLTLEFLEKMEDALKEQNLWASPASVSITNRPFWDLRTSSFLQFVATNVNKFLFAYETILT